MYQQLFDQKKQEEMRRYFLRLGNKGLLKKYSTGALVEIDTRDNFGIVMEGKLKQALYSLMGSEKSLYILQPGEIFGEMDFFTCGRNNIIGRAMENSIVSVINRNVIEEELKMEGAGYNYFLHSVTRKFRIIMLQMAGLVFNDSLGKLAEILLRLASQEGREVGNGLIIDIKFIHEDLASLIGCSRATVTKGLNKLKNEGIIEVENKKILIYHPEELERYINLILCEQETQNNST